MGLVTNGGILAIYILNSMFMVYMRHLEAPKSKLTPYFYHQGGWVICTIVDVACPTRV